VTQSGGSRYESGRTMPKPVRQLLRLVHVERIDLSRVKKEDFEIIDHLKSNHADLYQSLRKAARSKRRKSEETQALARLLIRWAGGLVQRRNRSCALGKRGG